MDRSRIVNYYHRTLPFYKLFWHHGSGSNALHLGFWDRNIKSIHQALLNENQFLAEKVDAGPGQRILDAGCGIGGSAIWLATNYGAHVIGISLSKNELSIAHATAGRRGVGSLAQFYVMDYLQTGFPDSSFDIVWAIESMCHTEHKEDFAKEAHRLLKAKGKLIVADGFLKRPGNDAREQTILKHFVDGFALPNLALDYSFEKSLKNVGFKNIQRWDKTSEVRPSSRRMYLMCLISYYMFKVAERFTTIDDVLIKSVLAGVAQYQAVKRELCTYLVFSAEK
jgi:tocopherol O-methyltransferase